MRFREINVSNSKLKEGDYHVFRILKLTCFGDGDSWYVMQDPLGYKVLMPAGFYSGYGFEAGQDILCRVDRINCNGKMFLEPLHPFYKEGEIYEFDLLGIRSRKGLTDDDEHFAEVKDILGNTWDVKIAQPEDIDPEKKTINCHIERIKKGKLFLRAIWQQSPDNFEDGMYDLFIITGEIMNPEDGQKYFILQNQSGVKQLLKKKYFMHYGLKPGQQINCRIDKFTQEGFSLEPENPWYKIGENYEFEILEVHKLIFSNGSVQYILLLDEPNSEPVKVFLPENEDPERFMNISKVTCKVTGYRKSRLEMEII